MCFSSFRQGDFNPKNNHAPFDLPTSMKKTIYLLLWRINRIYRREGLLSIWKSMSQLLLVILRNLGWRKATNFAKWKRFLPKTTQDRMLQSRLSRSVKSSNGKLMSSPFLSWLDYFDFHLFRLLQNNLNEKKKRLSTVSQKLAQNLPIINMMFLLKWHSWEQRETVSKHNVDLTNMFFGYIKYCFKFSNWARTFAMIEYLAPKDVHLIFTDITLYRENAFSLNWGKWRALGRWASKVLLAKLGTITLLKKETFITRIFWNVFLISVYFVHET